MIDHTGLQVSDPVVSRAFYDNALAPLGYKMMVQIPEEHTAGAAVFGYGVTGFRRKPISGSLRELRTALGYMSPSVPKLISKWTSFTKLRLLLAE